MDSVERANGHHVFFHDVGLTKLTFLSDHEELTLHVNISIINVITCDVYHLKVSYTYFRNMKGDIPT